MAMFFKRQHLLRATGRILIVLWFFVLFPSGVIFNAFGATPSQEQSNNLRRQIDEIQKQIDAYRAGISDLRSQRSTLKREISLLDNKTKTVELGIRRIALSIQDVEVEISDMNSALSDGELELNNDRQLLGQYVRSVYEADQSGTLEMILKNEKLSDIFDEIDSLQNIQKGIQSSMAAISRSRTELESSKKALEDKRDELNQLNVLQEIQKRSLTAQQNDKKNLLVQTRGRESNYQNLIKKASVDIEAIRNNLYLLEGIGLSMTLEKAYQYAGRASGLTGIRPAFLLAVLKNESSWGEKVGTGNWRKDMNPRDRKAFIQICDSLNIDPDKTAVSRRPSYGWGGAMGPAQFLPSVWLSYSDRISQLTKNNPANPWDIEDAFVAASLKLTQAGANVQTYNSEWKAAQIYFAGKRWNNPAYYFYGDQVMETADMIQEQLNIIAR